VPEQLVTSSAERLASYGVLGILTIVFGVVIWYLWKEGTKERKELLATLTTERAAHLASVGSHTVTVERLQQLRIDDAKAYQTQLVELTKGATTALTNVAQLLDQNKETLIEVRDTMREVGDDIRRRP